MLPLKTIPDVSNRKGHGHTVKPRAKPAPPKKRLRVGSVESTSGTKISTVEAQTHQENDTLSDLSDLSWHRHLRQNQTDLINLVKAMYLSKQDPDACPKAIRQPKTLTDSKQCSLTPGIIS